MTAPTRFLEEFARARAEHVVDTPGGFAVLSPRGFPHAHDHNCLWVTGPVVPADLLAAAEERLAPFGHRRVEVAAPDDALVTALTAAGYAREDTVVMTWRRPPDDDRPPGTGVTELTVAERVAFAARAWAEDFGQDDPAVCRELAGRAHSALPAARCTFLGVVEDGVTRASCDLFVRGDTAQIEEVGTLTPFRGRGYASRLVRAAVERATTDDPDRVECGGADLRAPAASRVVFLLADAADWPRRLYGRLGFEVTGTRTVWSRALSVR